MTRERKAGRLRVLACAYACDPNRGSEPGVGWTWVRELARHVDLDVITADHRGSRVTIEQALAHEPWLAAAVRFHFLADFVDLAWRRHPRLMRYYQPLYYRYYRRWMWSAYELARELVARERFDLAHQLTMIGYREPGYLWKLPVPFIWGPIGGTQDVPWPFLPSLGCVEACRHAARNTINTWQFRRHRRFRAALARAGGLICTATDTAKCLRDLHARDSIVVPASFAPEHHPLAHVRQPDQGVLRLVFSGLQVSRKGLPFALRALACLPADVRWSLDVIGSGPMASAWTREAARLGLGDRVVWHGQVARDRALAIMSAADVFLFPSLQEGSPAVVVEALALGLPVITTDHHGMADYIDDSCGVKLAVNTPRALVADLATALLHCARERGEVERMSHGALERGHKFSPGVQMPRVLALYGDVVAGGNAHGAGKVFQP